VVLIHGRLNEWLLVNVERYLCDVAPFGAQNAVRFPIRQNAAVEREHRLETEYHQLRDDERQWGSRAVSLGSFYLVAVGTTLFFLLGSGSARHVVWVDVVAPFPAFGITAVVIRQGITATVRSRLMLAYERALAAERSLASASAQEFISLNSKEDIPIGPSYHAQRPWLQGSIGKYLAWIERLPLLLVIGLSYLAVSNIQEVVGLVLSAVVDGALILALVKLSWGATRSLCPGPTASSTLRASWRRRVVRRSSRYSAYRESNTAQLAR
jgi:hypothetical protein